MSWRVESLDAEEAKLDGFHEECGVFGVYGHPEAANLVYLGLYGLQHRGQESAGIVSSNGKSLISHRGMGLVADIFNTEVLARPRRHQRDRPQSLFHHRFDLAQELPAAGRRVCARRPRARAQRQPGQFRGIARTARSERLDLSVLLRQRTHHPSDRRLACADAGRARHRGAAQVSGAYSLVVLTEHDADRGARSAWASGRWCSASSTARRSSPPRPARSIWCAPNISAKSSRARWS